MPTHHILRFRQVHLDFHTSPKIPGIGERFDRRQFQSMLKKGFVDSITLFSKCHHGWSYHPTSVGRKHPHLSFDLLDAQIEACREINVNHPIYLSAGLDNAMAAEHPEWRRISPDGGYAGWAKSPIEPGFHLLCFNTPYLDYLCDQIREVVARYPQCHGVFLDIIGEGECCCKWCMEWMAENGLDATRPEDRKKAAAHTIKRYYEQITVAATSVNADTPVFHNSGNILVGRRDRLQYFSHLELESLPTGGWGYDHYPMSAKYVGTLGLDFLGMTGKFHTTWGEFGGFKHPNALTYECAAMLAFGSKCSVGDQLHPDGEMDETTYSIIGQAYAEVERKEPWCRDVCNVADIALVVAGSLPGGAGRLSEADIGAGRVLLEGHFLFDIVDCDADFTPYRMLVLPDDVRVGVDLKAKLDSYLAAGGKLFLCGKAGLNEDRSAFLFDVGAETEGDSPFEPSYILPSEDIRADFVSTPNITHFASQRLRVTTGKSLGDVFDPYFNRTYEHFSSHQHTPNRPEASGYACGVQQGSIVYLAQCVFTQYHALGVFAIREYIVKAMRLLLGEDTVALSGLPSTGRVTLMEQAAESRFVLHLLYANTVLRGGRIKGFAPIEVIEELLPLADIGVTVRSKRPISRVRLVPEGVDVPFTHDADGVFKFTVPTLCAHQMVELL